MVELTLTYSNTWSSRYMVKMKDKLLECKKWWDKCKNLRDRDNSNRIIKINPSQILDNKEPTVIDKDKTNIMQFKFHSNSYLNKDSKGCHHRPWKDGRNPSNRVPMFQDCHQLIQLCKLANNHKEVIKICQKLKHLLNKWIKDRLYKLIKINQINYHHNSWCSLLNKWGSNRNQLWTINSRYPNLQFQTCLKQCHLLSLQHQLLEAV